MLHPVPWKVALAACGVAEDGTTSAPHRGVARRRRGCGCEPIRARDDSGMRDARPAHRRALDVAALCVLRNTPSRPRGRPCRRRRRRSRNEAQFDRATRRARRPGAWRPHRAHGVRAGSARASGAQPHAAGPRSSAPAPKAGTRAVPVAKPGPIANDSAGPIAGSALTVPSGAHFGVTFITVPFPVVQ
jgi:hypothetical protein